MKKHIFTYGSLMYPEVWQQLVTGNYESCQATLNGFHRKCVIDQDYPAVYKDDSSLDNQVLGRVYFDVSPEDQVSLDKFEGEEYLRLTETAITTDNNEITIEIYVIKPDFLHRVSERDWDVQAFEAEGLQRFLQQYKGFES
ncbi:gamma-glutamylcyclotransferase family protein [Hydrogenovibrio marinus]|uniref:Putative gamma-glutamylcyclotransferase n=1 Tax=Hydrogenovibrio marinus TaxID=28885 RepID=A0A066ZP31_HYDMR|nr:gamma-glutamylcyclotransferase family protein [Hydrogenovibrio marinus]KDN95242.1 hypothetical protein EI16_02755 [Hydrogenovibrio marinus]BBN59719.1 hypothetical protein HVMH_1313 [Hydrogenovibrio marinus]